MYINPQSKRKNARNICDFLRQRERSVSIDTYGRVSVITELIFLYLEFRTMGKVQNPDSSECSTPLTEYLGFYLDSGFVRDCHDEGSADVP
jgi:hypothetical protein